MANENMNLHTNPEEQILTDDGRPGFVCADCGAIYPLVESIRTEDGDLICEGCLDRDYVRCNDCGAVILRVDAIETAYGYSICEDCYDNYFTCDECGEVYSLDESYPVNEHIHCATTLYVCGDCLGATNRYGNDRFVQCDGCGDWVTRDRIAMSDSYRDICEYCADEWTQCENCGAVVNNDDAYYDDESGTYLCHDCFHDLDERRGSLHEYSYKPSPVFGTTDSSDGGREYTGGDLTFGVELEIDGGDDVSDTIGDIADLTDRAYCKHDGSLGLRGIEIVTHPGTLAWHRERFPWAEVCDAALGRSYRSHDTSTCGLHVHVGRDQLAGGNDTIAKMDIVTARHKDSFTRFSRRGGESRWCEYTDFGRSELRKALTEPDTMALRKVYANESGDRYRAVNRTNSSTVEIRIFRGTLKYTTVLASIELVSNLVRYCDTHTLDDCLSCTWDDIVHCEEFPELTAYNTARMAGTDYTPVAFTRGLPESLAQLTVSANEYGNLWNVPVTLCPETVIPDVGDLVYDLVEHRFGIIECYYVAGGSLVTGVWFTPNDRGYSLWATETDKKFGLVGHGWNVSRNSLRRVDAIGNRIVKPEYNGIRAMYHETGLLPGDRVTCRREATSQGTDTYDPSAERLLTCLGTYESDELAALEACGVHPGQGTLLLAAAEGRSVLSRWDAYTDGHDGDLGLGTHDHWWLRKEALQRLA